MVHLVHSQPRERAQKPRQGPVQLAAGGDRAPAAAARRGVRGGARLRGLPRLAGAGGRDRGAGGSRPRLHRPRVDTREAAPEASRLREGEHRSQGPAEPRLGPRPQHPDPALFRRQGKLSAQLHSRRRRDPGRGHHQARPRRPNPRLEAVGPSLHRQPRPPKREARRALWQMGAHRRLEQNARLARRDGPARAVELRLRGGRLPHPGQLPHLHLLPARLRGQGPRKRREGHRRVQHGSRGQDLRGDLRVLSRRPRSAPRRGTSRNSARPAPGNGARSS